MNKSKSNSRTAPSTGQVRDPVKNRGVLIEATLGCIADMGIAETTVRTITERSGLSRGMIHLHFGGKSGLLIEAARSLSADYYAEMDRQLALSDGTPVDTILRLARADLSPEILNTRTVALWHAFRGEARTSETLARISDTRDKRLREMIAREFRALLDPDGDNRKDVQEITLGLLAMLEGFWSDYLNHPDHFSRTAALGIVARFLEGVCPTGFARHAQTLTRDLGEIP